MNSRIYKYLVRPALGILGLVLGIVILLHTGWGLNLVGQFVLSRLQLFDHAHLTVDELSGSPFRRLTFEGVRLTAPNDSTLAEIESVEAGYQLLPMLRGEFHFTDLNVHHPSVYMTQQEDLSWDLFSINDQREDTSSSSAIFTLNVAQLLNGSVIARTYTGGQDSTYKITDLNLQSRRLEITDEFSAEINRFDTNIWIPHTTEPAALSIKADIDGSTIRVDSLSLNSNRSKVVGKGNLFFSTIDSLLYQNELHLNAAPLAFDDVRLFLPGLAPGHLANIDIQVASEEDNLAFEGKVRLSDGARFSIEGAYENSSEGLQNLKAESELSNFNPSMLTDTQGLSGLFNARATVSLSGKSLSELSGHTLVTLFNSSWQDHNLDSTFLDLELRSGDARLSLHTGTGDATLDIAGSLSPFAETPTYDLAANLNHFDARAFLEEDARFTSDLNATARMKGQGFTLAEAVTSLDVDILRSTINTFEITSGGLAVTFENGRMAHIATINAPNSQITSDGAAVNEDAFVIEHLDFAVDQLDIMSLLGDTLESTITGTSRISGTIDKNGEIAGLIDAEFSRVLFNNVSLTNASLNGAWEKGQVTFSSAGAIQSGTYSLEGLARVAKDSISYEISKGQFSKIDIGDFLTDSNQQSSLNGSIFFVGTGSDLKTMTLSGQVALTDSRLNQQPIDAASTWFALRSDTLNLDFNLALPEGDTEFSGRVYSLSGTPGYTISKGSFNKIDLEKLAGIEGMPSDLNGELTLQGSGTTLDSLIADVDLSLSPSHLNEVDIKSGKASVQMDHNSVFLQSDVQFETGSFLLDADLSSLDSEPVYEFNTKLVHVDVARLLGSDSTQSDINLEVTGSGRKFDPRVMSLTGKLSAGKSIFQNLIFDNTELEFSIENGLLTVDTLFAKSNVAAFSGKGPIALFHTNDSTSSAFVLKSKLSDLSPFQEFLPAQAISAQNGTLIAEIEGSRPLRFDVQLDATGFVYDSFHIGELNTRLSGELDDERSLSYAFMRGSVTAVSVPGFIFEDIQLESEFDSTKITFATNSRLDQNRYASISGSYLFGDVVQMLNLDHIELSLDEDLWSLNQPATIELGSSYRVDHFLIESQDQHIALDGVINLNGQQDVKLDVQNFRVGTVADLLGFSGLDGPVTSHVQLSGPANAPVVKGDLKMELITFDKDAGNLSITMAYDSLQLNLDASLDQDQKNVARLNGFLPVDLSLTTPEESTTGAGISQNVAMGGGIDFSIDADSMSVDWFLPFIDPTLLDRLEGALTAHIKIEGTAEQPTLAGTGRLVDGKLRSPLLGVVYENVASDISLRDNVIELTNTEMRSGDGVVSGNGVIELSDLTSAILDINVNASDFLAISTREYRATASGNMALTGTLTAPELTGDVRVLSADMFLNESSSSDLADLNVQLTEEDLLMLETEFGIRAGASDTTTFDFLEALKMDLSISLERDVWMRSKKNPEMNIQFSGKLDVSKAPYGEYIAFGSIDLIPDRSYINQFGKRFDITLGNLTFNGPATDPQLDFEARYEVPARRSQENAVTIFLDAEGQVENLDLTLRSDPTMELTDILSYIATGQPASEALQLGGIGGQSLASTGAGFALNQSVGLLTGALESLLQDSGLELDVIQIEPLNNAKGATITAGKYVTPRIFTAVSQPIGASDSDGTSTSEEGTVITLELELVDSLLLRLLGGESVMQINLLWHYSY